ncbi:Homeobox-leucine zipper protein HOX32 [Hibiscus syriacus]|uniref:Homeobox-leucine zipper protein HOX32 n=1 Tax=Hibiscus syriacus TaxID=106335 RepID=A0A6A3CTJ8_HIBSY|nr:Homeobox-leucine zipper protein HOX32 [Hibiscus syriacus]
MAMDFLQWAMRFYAPKHPCYSRTCRQQYFLDSCENIDQSGADSGIDAYSAAAVKAGPCGLPVVRGGSFGGQVILPLAHTIENEEFMEVIKLENMGHYREDMIMPNDIFLLQLCSGVDENAVGTCAELIFAPIDASFSDDAPIIPSGFRIIPLDSVMDASSPNRTLDLASTLEIGASGNRPIGDNSGRYGSTKSVMTIAFQFVYEIYLQEMWLPWLGNMFVVLLPRFKGWHWRSPPSHLGSHAGLRTPPGTPEAQTLAQWICQSYRIYLGVELLEYEGSESILKRLWHHTDAILCCSLKALPVFTFANQAGLDMLETTLVALQDITLEKIFDDNGRKALFAEFPQVMQQGFMCLQGGICLSSMGRPISYERAVAWKVINDEENAHCICFMFINWSFV